MTDTFTTTAPAQAPAPVAAAAQLAHKIGMTAAEEFWYVLGCIAFGAAYFMKVPVAKALAELGQFKAARAVTHDQLATLPGGAAQLEAAVGAGRIAGAREPDRSAQMTHAA
jgi:hypothetical protein